MTFPHIHKDIEILEVIPMDFYNSKSSKNGTEYCWNKYIGPHKLLQNKTDGCLDKLDERRVYNKAVRAQTCVGPKYPLNENEAWEKDECTLQPSCNQTRIQIIELEGAHKIYCYPFNIEIEGELQPCPITPFLLDGHKNYKIADVKHLGIVIDASINRQIRSTEESWKRSPRLKRSPIAAITTSTAAPTSIANLTTSPLPLVVLSNKTGFVQTIRKLTSRMNNTYLKLQATMSKITAPLNITKLDLESIFQEPLEFIGDTFKSVKDIFKELGASIGGFGFLLILIAVVPILEIVILGVKIVKIQADIWIGSAKRVSRQISSFFENIRSLRGRPVRSLIKRAKRGWDTNKVV